MTTRVPTNPPVEAMSPRQDDTGRLSRGLHHAFMDSAAPTTPAMGVQSTPSAEEFLEALAKKLVEKGGGGDGGGGRRYLGLHSGEWVKLFVGWIVLTVISLATWYLSVRDGLGARPTMPEVQKMTSSAMAEHERVGEHPRLERRLDAMEQNVQIVRDSQIRQEEVSKQQTETLQDIKQSLRRRPER